jgi:hypothetical protein
LKILTCTHWSYKERSENCLISKDLHYCSLPNTIKQYKVKKKLLVCCCYRTTAIENCKHHLLMEKPLLLVPSVAAALEGGVRSWSWACSPCPSFQEWEDHLQRRAPLTGGVAAGGACGAGWRPTGSGAGAASRSRLETRVDWDWDWGTASESPGLRKEMKARRRRRRRRRGGDAGITTLGSR